LSRDRPKRQPKVDTRLQAIELLMIRVKIEVSGPMVAREGIASESLASRGRARPDLHGSTHAARCFAGEILMMRPILVVDDSPTIRRMVRAALAELASAGFVEAASGLQAIERLTLTPVSLMVLDLNMPDIHGVEVLKFVRRHPVYQQLPGIVLTTLRAQSD